MSLDLFGPASAPNAVTIRPADSRAFGATDTFFKDCSSDDADDGTELQSAVLNQAIAVLRTIARANGTTGLGGSVVVEDNADDAILLKAIQHLIQRGQVQYGVDTGSINSVVASLTPAPAEYKAGMIVRILMAAANTDAAVINLNALGTKAITWAGDKPLTGGEWAAGQIVEMVFDGTRFQVIGVGQRQRLAANTTIYVNGTTGNDATLDGSAAVVSGVHGPFKTIGKAFQYAAGFGPSAYTLTINVADGTYPESLSTVEFPGPKIVVNGNAGAPSNVHVTGAPNQSTFAAIGPNTLTVQNLKVSTHATGAGNCGFIASGGATINTSNTVSGNCNFSVFEALGPSTVVPGTHSFAGNAVQAFAAFNGGYIAFPAVTYSIIGSPTYTVFAVATTGGNLGMSSGFQPTFVGGGAVTGIKFNGSLNGVINTAGMGVNYFPGTVAGSVATGAQYA